MNVLSGSVMELDCNERQNGSSGHTRDPTLTDVCGVLLFVLVCLVGLVAFMSVLNSSIDRRWNQ